MIILDEKMLPPPPPPYAPSAGQVLSTPPPFPPSYPSNLREPPRLDILPPHLLLRIVYTTFTQTSSPQKQRKTLYWLNINLRLVNRALYVACMHVLRSTYLPAYAGFIRPPYSSDPFPLNPPTFAPDPSVSPIQSLQRETRVLDLFIALKVREDVWADESELHLERDESFRDVFDLMQPRSRLEDLVRAYGVRYGAVTLSANLTSPSAGSSGGSSAPVGTGSSLSEKKARDGRGSSATSNSSKLAQLSVSPAPLPFAALSVSFSSRRVGIVLTTRQRKRTIVEVERTRDERLESSAKKLAKELRSWLVENS